MARYSIEDTTLTALGDAVRGKVGETKDGYVDTDTWKVEVKKGLIKSYYFPAGTRSAKIEKVSYSGHVVTNICDSNGNELKDENGNKYGWDFYLDEVKEIYIEDMDVHEFKVYHNGAWLKDTFYGEFKITSYDADGNVIQVPGIVKNTLTPLQMAEAIEGLPLPPPESAFTITGDCSYRFANTGWNWFIEQYGDRITTKDITGCSYMFTLSNIEEIPSFDINFKDGGYFSIGSMFSNCKKLTKVSNKIIGKVSSLKSVFTGCEMLREVSDEFASEIDGSYLAGLTSTYSGDTSNIFKDCYSLRKYPNNLLKLNNPLIGYNYATYRNLFQYCYALDEVVDLPVVHRRVKWTSNAFYNTFNYCDRLRKLTFETNEDGSPIKINTWSNQAINLSIVGFASNSKYITNYNSGITTAKAVYDDATYQALKDDADWYTSKIEYSRYNKTSAIETINTLPDLSGGAGGNTIKFTGAAGFNTDGGAINTMTQEEIAVATAKGWTVSFV